MEKSSLKIIIVTGIVVVLVIGLPLFLWGRYQGYKANFKTSPSSSLQIYSSPAGLFTFKYPKGFAAGEQNDPEQPGNKIVFIYRVDAAGEAVQGPPVMQITVLGTSGVTFSLWEGKAWGGFEDIVHSFVFKK